MALEDLTRQWHKVDINVHGCWEWLGQLRPDGYGCAVQDKKGKVVVHRLFYEEIFKVKIIRDPNITIDHLCFNRRCVNPWHMELVTRAENTRRSNARRAYHIGTHCKFGHPRSEHLYVTPKGMRGCRVCATRRQQEYRERQKEPA